MSVIQKTVLPMDVSVLQWPSAASGRVCFTATSCCLYKHVYYTEDGATSGRVLQQPVLPLNVSVIQKAVLPLDLPVLQQPFAASGLYVL